MPFKFPFFRNRKASGGGTRPGAMEPGADKGASAKPELEPGDAYVNAIGEALFICADRKCTERGLESWDSLAQVYTVGDGFLSNQGYLYHGEMIAAFSAELSEAPLWLDNKVVEFREFLTTATSNTFLQLLIQMERSSKRIRIDFEFDDRDRWSINPRNLRKMRETLRPVF